MFAFLGLRPLLAELAGGWVQLADLFAGVVSVFDRAQLLAVLVEFEAHVLKNADFRVVHVVFPGRAFLLGLFGLEERL